MLGISHNLHHRVDIISGSLTKQHGLQNVEHLLELWTNAGPNDENTLDKPELIHPVPLTVQCTADKKQTVLSDQLPAMSFRLYKIKK